MEWATLTCTLIKSVKNEIVLINHRHLLNIMSTMMVCIKVLLLMRADSTIHNMLIFPSGEDGCKLGEASNVVCISFYNNFTIVIDVNGIWSGSLTFEDRTLMLLRKQFQCPGFVSRSLFIYIMRELPFYSKPDQEIAWIMGNVKMLLLLFQAIVLLVFGMHAI